jgi:putative membrane protein
VSPDEFTPPPGASGERPPRPSPRVPLALLVSALAVLAWSGWEPRERGTWWAETVPAMVGAVLLLLTYRRFRLSTVSYVLAWLFALILMVGGHWTYAEVPAGEWARDAFGLSRNHYDRFGHFFQGVIPAMLTRELLVRLTPVRSGGWLFTVCAAVGLAVSALYEMIEWWFAETFGGAEAVRFLGSQGDVWDAQKDMLMALLGAVSSLLLLSRWQQRQIDALETRSGPHA